MIANETHLDELLAQPSSADVESIRSLNGDLVILGAAGKMGPTLALRARRAIQQAGFPYRVIAVSRFSSPEIAEQLQQAGIEVVQADLLQRDHVSRLPKAPNLLYMAGRKFGSTGAEALTWAMNVYVPTLVSEHYAGSRIVALSSGNVYPLVPIHSGGASESVPPNPVGEYAQSVLGRERIFEYFAQLNATPTVLIRLNYAAEMRYGVLLDIGAAVFERRPVDLSMAAVNVIWQGDANSVCLRAFGLCGVPARVLNVTGPETVSVRYVSNKFGDYLGVQPLFTGAEADYALLNNAGLCHRLFGYPSVSLDQLVEWTAQWIGSGGRTHGKPTHFEVRDGQF